MLLFYSRKNAGEIANFQFENGIFIKSPAGKIQTSFPLMKTYF